MSGTVYVSWGSSNLSTSQLASRSEVNVGSALYGSPLAVVVSLPPDVVDCSSGAFDAPPHAVSATMVDATIVMSHIACRFIPSLLRYGGEEYPASIGKRLCV